MARYRGFYQYAVCDGTAGGHRCTAFIAPAPHGDPFGPGHVFAGHLDVTLAGRAAGWLMADDGRTLCPAHRPAEKPTTVTVVELPAA